MAIKSFWNDTTSLVFVSFALAISPWAMRTAVGAEEASAVTPDQAIQRLLEGNTRYQSGHPTHPHADVPWREDAAQHGQHPFATVLTCSDSRVPVEMVFDEGIGDVFVVRVAGNVCGTDEIGSIEYAVEHLGTPLVLVLGHTHCGAVTAAATHAEVHDSVARLAEHIAPAVARAEKDHPDLHGEALVPAAIEANVWQSVEELFQKSPAVREMAAEGKVKVAGAVYDIQRGTLHWLGEHPESARLLKR